MGGGRGLVSVRVFLGHSEQMSQLPWQPHMMHTRDLFKQDYQSSNFKGCSQPQPALGQPKGYTVGMAL